MSEKPHRRMLRAAGTLVVLAVMILGMAEPQEVRAAEGISSAYAKMQTASGYTFDRQYAVPGDTVRIIDAQTGEEAEAITVNWTVKKLVDVDEGGTPLYEKLAEAADTTNFLITEAYRECFIYAEVDGEILSLYCSDIPVFYINTEDQFDLYSVDSSFSDYVNADMNLVGNDEYSDQKYWYQGDTEIKLRGNSTRSRPKRPFKIKLGSKADLLGLGGGIKSKHWVLLANDIDHTLMRNKLLYDFSGDIGTEYYFESTNVSLIYNGEYQGVYQLCEHRRVDEGRIEITDWEGIGEDAADAIGKGIAKANGYDKARQKELIAELEELFISDYSWLDTKMIRYDGSNYRLSDYGIDLPARNGGYLMEMDFFNIGNDRVASIESRYKQPLYFSTPEPGADSSDPAAVVRSFKNTGLYTFAKTYNQVFEYALHSDDFFFRTADPHYRAVSWQSYNDIWSAEYQEVSDYRNKTEYDGMHYSELFDFDSLVNNFIFCEYAMNWDSMKNSFFYYKEVDELARIGPQWDFDWAWGNRNMYNIDTWSPTDWHTTINYFTREQYYQSVQWNRMLIRDPYFLVKSYEKYQQVRPIIEAMTGAGGLIDTYRASWANAGAANDRRWQHTYHSYGGETFTDAVSSMKDFLNTRVAWLDEQFADVDTLVESLGYYQTSDKITVSGIDTEAEAVRVTATVGDSNIRRVVFQINGTNLYEAEVEDGRAVCRVPDEVLETAAGALNTIVVLAKDGSGSYLYNQSASIPGNYKVPLSDYATFQKGVTVLAEEITLNKERLTLNTGQTAELNTSFKPIDTSLKAVNWSSSDEKVATVEDGVVTARAAGKAVITAVTLDGSELTAECVIHVSDKNYPLINQIYGGGNKGDTAVSHSFIELFNPTGSAIALKDYTILYNGSERLALNDVILPAGASYLIRGSAETTTSVSLFYVIEAADQEWDLALDNKAVRVELFRGDLLVDEAAISEGISKQKSARRINFRDTNDEDGDFAIVEYRNIRPEDLERYRPRSLAEGPWSGTLEDVRVKITGTAKVGETLRAEVSGMPAAQVQYQWTADYAEIPGANRSAYTVTADMLGKIISVVVSGRETDGIALGNRTAAVVKADDKTDDRQKDKITAVTLNKQELILNVDQTGTLTAAFTPANTAAQALVWSSSNQAIVTVDNGRLKAKAPGKASITAAVKGEPGLKAICTVYVRCGKASLTLKKSTANIKLSWSAVRGAKEYAVYRSAKVNSGFKKIGETAKRTFTDKQARAGSRYYYRITALHPETKCSGAYSNTADGLFPRKPTGLKLTKKGGRVTVKWKKAKGASGYEVHRSAKRRSGYKKVKTVTRASRTTFKDGKARRNRTYYYKVRAYYQKGEVKIYSTYSAVKKIKTDR